MSEPSEALLTLDNQLCFALYAANRAMNAAYRPMLEQLGLTYPQYLVLLVLWEENRAIPVNGLGKRLFLDSGTLTPLLKRMEKAGLILRARAHDDERVVEVCLTESGKALKKEALSRVHRLVCAPEFDAGEMAALREALKSLNLRLRNGDGQCEAVPPDVRSDK